MPGAKARLREFWIRGKRINQVKHRSVLKRQVERSLKREISYISSFFPYDIKRFHNPDLIFFQGLLLYGTPSRVETDSIFKTRVINLATGLELLSIGTTFHDFKITSSDHPGRIDIKAEEKAYTLDLLFGDIFYSRAVIYLLKYRDHKTFERILEALKKLHESRLKLHIVVQDAIKGKKSSSSFSIDTRLIIDANKLFQVAIEIGSSLLDEERKDTLQEERKGITGQLIAYKTYSELLKYIESYPEGPAAGATKYRLLQNMKDARLKFDSLAGDISQTDILSSLEKLVEGLG